MGHLKKWLDAFYRLLGFGSSYYMPRELEIGFSILAWLGVIIIINGFM